jgi:membrane protease YdiL (CAAX protease family)
LGPGEHRNDGSGCFSAGCINELPIQDTGRRSESADQNPTGHRQMNPDDDPARAPPDDATPHWGWIATLAFTAAFGAIDTVLNLYLATAATMIRHPDASADEFAAWMAAIASDGTAMPWMTVVADGVLCLLVLIAIRLRRGARVVQYLALRPVPWRALGPWAAASLALVVATEIASRAVGRDGNAGFLTDLVATADSIVLLALAIGVVAPIAEEILFRGFLYRGLINTRLGIVGTTLLNSAMFAALHTQYDAFDIGSIFLVGVLASLARWRTGSLLAPIAVHMLINAVSIGEMLVTLRLSAGA